MRIIGLDVHRTFAKVAIREHGRVRPAGRISTTTAGLQLFVRRLTRWDEVVLEATCNTHAIARLLRAHAAGRSSEEGRAWLATQSLPADERAGHEPAPGPGPCEEDLTELDRGLAGAVLEDAAVRRPGDPGCRLRRRDWPRRRHRGRHRPVAAEARQLRRSESPGAPVGLQPAQHGRITKQGRATRGACWSKPPGSRRKRRTLAGVLCAGAGRRGHQIAAVATARKLPSWRGTC